VYTVEFFAVMKFRGFFSEDNSWVLQNVWIAKLRIHIYIITQDCVFV